MEPGPFLPIQNNLAEGDLRKFAIIRKISGETKSLAGDRSIERHLSVIQTAKKQGLDVFQTLHGLLIRTTTLFRTATKELTELLPSIHPMREKAINALPHVVVPDTITGGKKILACAATKDERLSIFPDLFGRDTAWVMHLMLDAYELSGAGSDFPENFDDIADAFLNLENYQAKEHLPGEEDPLVKVEKRAGLFKGEIPHQVRLGPFAPDSWVVEQNWYRVPTQDKQEKEVELMVSGDSADATILYAWGLLRLGKIRPEIFTRENGKYKKSLLAALEWCEQNIEVHGGLPGYIHYRKSPERPFLSKDSQNWEDSKDSHLFEDSNPPADNEPVNTPELSAFQYAVYLEAADFLEAEDKEKAEAYRRQAKALKTLFNDPEKGFVMLDGTRKFSGIAEGIATHPITKQRQQMRGITANAGFAFYHNYRDETGKRYCILDDKYQQKTVDIMLEKLYEPGFGLKTIQRESGMYEPTHYHSGPFTFWSFQELAIAMGLIEHGMIAEGLMIGTDTIAALQKLGLQETDPRILPALYDFREVYMKNARGELVPWMLYDKTLKEVIGEEKTKDYLERLKKARLNPDQEGAIGQAWTIAAVIAYDAFLRRLLGARGLQGFPTGELSPTVLTAKSL